MNQQSQGFPAVPPSLAAGDHEMRDYSYSNQNAQQPHTVPTHTPYLGLRARLSQVWINRWTILLALIICRLLLAIASINDNLGNAKQEALSACTNVEKVGSAVASMPHYLSAGVNALAADGVTKAVSALMDMLLLTVTGVEEIVLFVINMMTSTYVCLITLAVSGSLHVAIEMIEAAAKLLEDAVENITSDMSSAVSTFEKGLNSFLSDINIGGIFGSSKDPPSIDLTSQIDALNKIDIDPTKLDGDLQKLNKSIPNFDQVHNFTNTMIRLPFEEIKRLINESLPAYTFDKSVFPVAQKKALTFCTDNSSIADFFDGLVETVKKARTIFIVVLTVLAVLVCIPMAYREIWRWRTMQQRSLLLQKHAFDPMDVIYIASRPYTTTFGIKAASKFKSTKRQILTRWAVAYATSLPALFVLALGLAGLFSCLCQYIVLKVVEKEVPALATEIGGFADRVVGALNNASEEWAVSANGVITTTNTNINNDVFGWVNTSTSAVNDTLNTFVDEMGDALNVTFGGTILYEPIKGVLNCLIGLKIAGIQKGLTWVHDNAHVDFPTFRSDVFSLGAAASLTNTTADDSFLASPGSVAGDDVTNAIAKVTVKLSDAIRQEAIISGCVVGIWFIIMFIGLIAAIIGMMGRDKTRGEGGPMYTGETRIPISPRSPNRGDVSKFPAFGGPVSSVHPQTSSDDIGGWQSDEKMGRAGHRSVEDNIKPGHERVSSHGYLVEKGK